MAMELGFHPSSLGMLDNVVWQMSQTRTMPSWSALTILFLLLPKGMNITCPPSSLGVERPNVHAGLGSSASTSDVSGSGRPFSFFGWKRLDDLMPCIVKEPLLQLSSTRLTNWRFIVNPPFRVGFGTLILKSGY
jgi:hypothetical protein